MKIYLFPFEIFPMPGYFFRFNLFKPEIIKPDRTYHQTTIEYKNMSLMKYPSSDVNMGGFAPLIHIKTSKKEAGIIITYPKALTAHGTSQ